MKQAESTLEKGWGYKMRDNFVAAANQLLSAHIACVCIPVNYTYKPVIQIPSQSIEGADAPKNN